MVQNKQWWKEAVAYQIYPRSFNDTNGDGIGDIPGIIEKLDYLEDLGINVIWISPMYDSPNDDNGYDIRDYQNILSDFGTMADFDRLLDAAHEKGMRIIMDLVINHTSDEHEWFIESRASKDNPYRDYYIWHSGKEDGSAPNNWESIFKGSIWEWDEKTQEYYLHVFSKKQPDLNWENPKVRQELYDMVNWWLDRGIDGFRIDAISHIKKKTGFPDLPNPENKKVVPSFDAHMNQPGIDQFLSELKKETFDHYDIMTVGEANGVQSDEAHQWVGEEDGYFDMIFQFNHLNLWTTTEGIDLITYKKVLTEWQEALDGKGWNALFIENHDLVRVVSSLGDDARYRERSAKAFGMMYFFMQGTPYIYQGQEIGMTNVQYDTLAKYDDIQSVNTAKDYMAEGMSQQEALEYMWNHSRDNVRTPMQWDSTTNAGFSTGTPWLEVNPNYTDINVEKALKDEDSIYHFYRQMITIRKENKPLIYGHYDLLLPNDEAIFAYTRELDGEAYLIVTNLSRTEQQMPLEGINLSECLLSNGKVDELDTDVLELSPYEARLYRINRK